jgi:hypothetical protein
VYEPDWPPVRAQAVYGLAPTIDGNGQLHWCARRPESQFLCPLVEVTRVGGRGIPNEENAPSLLKLAALHLEAVYPAASRSQA